MKISGRHRLLVSGGVLVILLLVLVALSFLVGSKNLTILEVWEALWAGRETENSNAVGIMCELRLPRTVLGIFAGAALGVAGALCQGHTRNPLAEPGLLGINAGAACAVVSAIFLGGISSPLQYMFFGLLGAAVALVLVFALSTLAGATPLSLVLAGVGLNATLAAVISLVIFSDGETLDAWRFWSVGSINGRGLEVALASSPFICLGLILAAMNVSSLNAMSLGGDSPRALGVRVGQVRALGIAAIALLAGSATAACGPIVFLGLAAPHLARIIVGVDYRWIYLYSAVSGSVIILAADIAGRVIARPGEVQAGAILMVIGAPIFIILVRSRKLVSV